MQTPETGETDSAGAGIAEMIERAIALRQNFTPRRLHAPGPDATELERLLMAATAAPDHGEIHPWRFVHIPLPERPALGELFRRALLERDPQATAEQQQEAADKAARAPCLLLAVVDLAPKEARIDPAERLISLGCAIQNMLLLAQAMGYGSGLSSGQAMQSPAMREAFALGPHEQAVCFVSFGTVAKARPRRPRPQVSQVLSNWHPGA